jgi:RNA polymerase sigma factor (sigma-70 family)
MQTDSEAIARSTEDPRSFGVLFERHARAVYGYLARRAGPDVADEVLSEVFLVAFQRRDAFDGRSTSARPWLLGIGTVLLRAHAKKEAKHLRVTARAAEAEAHDGGLERALDKQDASRRMRRMLDHLQQLPPIDRDVLLLYAWGELSYDEVAKSLGIPVGTVRSRLNRVRRELRRMEFTTDGKERSYGRADTAARV